jgi:putative addiction module killer protein
MSFVPKANGVNSVHYYIARNGRNYYDEWLGTLVEKDRGIVLDHVERLGYGLGDRKYLGDRLWELRIHFGPGYRVYFTNEGDHLIIVLAGSLKRKQERTIRLARTLIKENNTSLK